MYFEAVKLIRAENTLSVKIYLLRTRVYIFTPFMFRIIIVATVISVLGTNDPTENTDLIRATVYIIAFNKYN